MSPGCRHVEFGSVMSAFNASTLFSPKVTMLVDRYPLRLELWNWLFGEEVFVSGLSSPSVVLSFSVWVFIVKRLASVLELMNSVFG